MEFVPTLALAALVLKFTDFLKGLVNQNWNTVLTLLIVWASGVAAVWLFAQTDFAAFITVGDENGGFDLLALNGWSKTVIGLGGGSIASTIFDFKKAVDASDNAVAPSLLPSGGGG